MAIPVNTQSGIDAMGQAAQVGQAASVSAANFARAEETYANTALKYAELQQKFQDIAQRDMELDVLEAQQQGKLANADVYTQRNINMLRNVDKLTKADSIQASNGVIESQMKLNDNQRQQIASFADSVVDPQTHAMAYNQIAEMTKSIGGSPEDFGISQQWEGPEETSRQWMFNKNAAIASQELLGKERLASTAYKRQVERDDVLNEYQVERETVSMAFQAWQNDLDRQIKLEAARSRAAAASNLPVKRSDIDTMTTKEIQDSAAISVNQILKKGELFGDADDDEVQRYANEIAVDANKLVDQSVTQYNTTKQGRIVGPAEALQIVSSNFLDRTDNKGNVSTEAPRPLNELVGETKRTKIEQAKLSWSQSWKASLLQNDPNASRFTEGQLNILADMAWKDPTKRLK